MVFKDNVFCSVLIYGTDRDSSVGIATRYGLGGPGIVSRWCRDFPHSSRLALGPTQPPLQWVPGLSRGLIGRGVALTTPPSSAEVKERVELYLYSRSGPSWPLLGWPLPLPLPYISQHVINNGSRMLHQTWDKGTQMLGARSPGQQNFTRWHLFDATELGPRILMWFLGFLKIWAPLV
jgi:hypothetical protein